MISENKEMKEISVVWGKFLVPYLLNFDDAYNN